MIARILLYALTRGRRSFAVAGHSVTRKEDIHCGGFPKVSSRLAENRRKASRVMKPHTSIIALSPAHPVRADIRGRQVMAWVVRDPIPGPLQVGPEGPVDDSAAVHTVHTLACTADHYGFGAGEVGVARDAWNWAWWGENLTVD